MSIYGYEIPNDVPPEEVESFRKMMAERKQESDLLQANSRGHRWEVDEDGFVNTFAYSVDIHNGPVCTACGYHYCKHCQSGPSEDCSSVIDATCRDVPMQLPSKTGG